MVLDTIRKHYRQRDLAAREWKERGGKVAGYFCNNVPNEIIQAAGFLPYMISGNPNNGTASADEYTSSYDTPEGFVSSMLDMILTGEYDFLDFLVIPHARDSIHRLYKILTDIKSLNPETKIPELYFLDNLHTTFWLSQMYNRDRIYEFKTKLEEWSGGEISDLSLLRAMDISNENKRLLKEIAALRTAKPPLISGVEALRITGTSMFMQKEEHNELLRQYLQESPKLTGLEGIRLFVGGSPMDNTQLYEIIESCGATVVSEDNCWGNKCFDISIDVTVDNPLEAIIDSYHRRPPCPRIHPLARRIEYCVQSAKKQKRMVQSSIV